MNTPVCSSRWNLHSLTGGAFFVWMVAFANTSFGQAPNAWGILDCNGPQCGGQNQSSANTSNSTRASSPPPTSGRNTALGAAAGALEGLSRALSTGNQQQPADTSDDDYDPVAERQKQAALEAQGAQQAAQNQKSLANDPSLNPFGKSSSDNTLVSKSSSSGSAARSADSPPQSAASQALDPNADYDGKPCRYFTKGNDSAHLNYYSNNAMSIYGGRLYKCESGSWRYQYPSNILGDADQQRLDAARQESSSVSTDILESN